jgi:hypothetical protein
MGGGGGRAVQSERKNNATIANLTDCDLDNPFAEGGFRYVARGTYAAGERAGEACVCKWFKTGHVFEDTFYAKDIQATNMALHIVREWNGRRFIEQVVKVNVPEVWMFGSICRSDFANTRVLIEPFIDNYTKFNSNTGWADGSTPWPRLMQALSHFSYHLTGGRYVFCDIQGGIYPNEVVLTDPVILSWDGSYGVTDLGPKGISSFFSGHVCNEFCKRDWLVPHDRTRYFTPKRGSSMMLSGANHPVPTHISWAPAVTNADAAKAKKTEGGDDPRRRGPGMLHLLGRNCQPCLHSLWAHVFMQGMYSDGIKGVSQMQNTRFQFHPNLLLNCISFLIFIF